ALALPTNFAGTLQISAPASIAAIGLRSRTNERGEFMVSTTMPHQTSGPLSDLYVPHFVVGGGYLTQFVLLGSGATGSGGTILFNSTTGAPIPLAVLNSTP